MDDSAKGTMGAFFIFLFIAIGIVGFITVMAFISANDQPTVGSVATNVSIYVQNSSVVNHTMQFEQNTTSAGMAVLSPLPIIFAVIVLACALFVFLIVVKKR